MCKLLFCHSHIRKYYVIFCGVVAPLSFFVVFLGFTILWLPLVVVY